MPKMQNIAERLRVLRTKLGITQEQLANLLGLSRNYIGLMEKGREPSKGVLSRIEQLEAEMKEGNEVVIPDDGPAVDIGNARQLLKQARLRKALTVDQLAKSIRYSTGYLQALEEGRAPASAKVIALLEKALNLDPGTLYRGSEPGVIREDGLTAPYGTKPQVETTKGVGPARYIPLIGYSQAGIGNYEDLYEHESVIAFGTTDSKAFATRLRGDSMEPKYSEGDILYVSPNATPKNGDIVLAKVDEAHGGDVMCKLYSSRDGGKNIVLSSYNAAYPPMEFSRSIMQFVYPVSAVLKPLH